jgi:hypothetical protein
MQNNQLPTDMVKQVTEEDILHEYCMQDVMLVIELAKYRQSLPKSALHIRICRAIRTWFICRQLELYFLAYKLRAMFNR